MRVAARFRMAKQQPHQVGAVDAVGIFITGKPQQPNHRHPVRRYHTRLIMDASDCLVALALHDAMDAGDADVLAGIFGKPLVNNREGTFKINGADTNAQNVFPLVVHRLTRWPWSSW